MSLRRTFIIAFAAVAAAVAALVGAVSYDVTAKNLNVEIDDSLTTAVTTVQSGGSLPPPDAPVTSDGPGPGDHGPHGRSLSIIAAAQRVTPDGTVMVLLGDAIPVDADSRALAADTRSGQTRYRTQTIAGTPYRVLTRSTGNGAVMAARSLDVTDDVLSDLAIEITASGLAVLVVAAAGGWLIARRITRRLLLLTEAAEKVSATGRLDTAMGTSGRDEVGRLGTALDTMLAELARSREDQQRLVQNAGHELRTPLTSLRTNVSVLRRSENSSDDTARTALSADSRRRLLDDLDGETRELTTLVDELVELASDRRATEQPESVDLATLAEHTAQRFRRRTGREITVEGDAVVIGRSQALERALANLIDNAVKFDPAGHEAIRIRVRTDRIEVLDRGPGIEPADTAHVFERFYRATSARSVTGSGLGLAIVREIADLHEGTVFVTAREGGGTAIGLTLPAGGPDDEPEPSRG